jgi:hypothetical protein
MGSLSTHSLNPFLPIICNYIASAQNSLMTTWFSLTMQLQYALFLNSMNLTNCWKQQKHTWLNMKMKHWWNDTDRGKQMYLNNNQCHYHLSTINPKRTTLGLNSGLYKIYFNKCLCSQPFWDPQICKAPSIHNDCDALKWPWSQMISCILVKTSHNTSHSCSFIIHPVFILF